MKLLLRPIVATLSLVLAGALPARAADPQTANHVTATVVSVDAISRTLVIRVAGGPAQTVGLDDSLASAGDVKAGDRVILTLQKDPGRARVTWLAREADRRPAEKTVAAKAGPAPGPGKVTAADAAAAARTFASRTAAIAEEATRVDPLWRSFREGCDVKVSGQYEGSREWLSLWDDQAKADLSSGFCRDLFDQVVVAGSDVNKSMAEAEDGVRTVLVPGAIRDIRRRYSLDWDGWGRQAPALLEEK